MSRHHYHEIRFLKKGERLRDFVLGFNDGAVTTLAVTVALAAAGTENIVIILGALATMFGAGIAFMFSDYISVKSQMSFMKSYSYSNMTKHEKEEIRDISSQFDNPIKIASIAFGAFILSGTIAISPFIFFQESTVLNLGLVDALIVSMIVVFISIFSVGLYRAKYTHGNMLKSSTEMVLIAAFAFLAAYFIGTLLGSDEFLLGLI